MRRRLESSSICMHVQARIRCTRPCWHAKRAVARASESRAAVDEPMHIPGPSSWLRPSPVPACAAVSASLWPASILQVCLSGRQKAFITLGSPVVPLLSTSKADSGLASEFRWDRAGYTAYERMLTAQRARGPHDPDACHPHVQCSYHASHPHLSPHTCTASTGWHTPHTARCR